MKRLRSTCGEHREQGASLVVSLVMLVAVLMLGISATQIALQSEKTSRNERDRQIAFQAAEAALLDAERDIENSTASNSRSAMFSKDSKWGFPSEEEQTCGTGISNQSLGLCSHAPTGTTPMWIAVDFSDVDEATTQSVPIGHFTGQSFQTGEGALPSRPPRYVIELMTFKRYGEAADNPTYFYRVTAIGYGARDTTQVVVQSFYRKED